MAQNGPEKSSDSGVENQSKDRGQGQLNARPEHVSQVSIPLKEWEEMKAQNLRILKLVGVKEKRGTKRRTRDESDDSSQSEGEIIEKRPRKKYTHSDVDSEPEIDLEDVDCQIDGLLHDDEKKSDIHTDDGDSGLKEIEEEYESEEETGPSISEKLAGIIQTMSKAKLTDEKLKEKMEKHKRPENCSIGVPKVNPEIWGLMDHASKSVDLRLQRSQKKLVKATCALATVCDGFVKNPSQDAKGNLKIVTDAMALILKASHEMSMDRRVKIVSSQAMNKKYRKLASNEVPVSEFLFGDDLKASLASIDSASKLGQTLAQTNKSVKFFPRAKNWDSSFRGRGRGWNRGRMPMAHKGRGYTRGRRPWQQRPSHE